MDKERNLLSRFLWLAQRRPRQLYGAARGYALFYWARLLRQVLALEGVSLAENVRLQRNSSLMAEAPHASISIGAHSIIYEDARIEAYKQGKVSVGEYSIVGDAHIVSRYKIQIGKRFLSSWNVFIQDYDSHPTMASMRRQQVEHMVNSFRPRFAQQSYSAAFSNWDFPGEEIVIGDDVWLGAGSTILKGAKIGDGSVVATGAVVLRGVYPANSLLAGNPAEVIKIFPDSERIKHAAHDQNHSEITLN